MANHRKSKIALERPFVVSKSPVLRIHGMLLFFIHLRQEESGPTGDHFVLGRGEETVKFRNQLIVGASYTVNGLVSTTITKGTSTPRKILLFMPLSTVLPCDAPLKHVSDLSLYKGIVTKCVYRTLGIYETSDTHRLYLTYQYDGKSSLPIIPLGSEVTVCNPHELVLPHDNDEHLQGDRKVLVCCMRSSVSFEGKGQHPEKDGSEKQQRILLTLCVKLHPTLRDLEWLRCQAVPALLYKLVPRIIGLKELLPMLVRLLTSRLAISDAPIIQQRERNLYEEFLSHDAACSFSHVQKIEWSPPCVFPSVSELSGLIKEGGAGVSSILESEWQYDIIRSFDIKPSLVLVSQLCVDNRNGCLYLKDSSGTVPCALATVLPVPRTGGKDLDDPARHAKKQGMEHKRQDEKKDSVSTSFCGLNVSHAVHTSVKDLDAPARHDDKQVPVGRLKTNKADELVGHDGKHVVGSDMGGLSPCHPQPCTDHLLRIDDFVIVRESEKSEAAPLPNKENETEVTDSTSLCGNGNGTSLSGSKVKVYVMFNLRDALCLQRAPDRVMSASERRHGRKRGSQGSTPDGTNNESSSSRIIQLKCRRPLFLKPSSSTSSSSSSSSSSDADIEPDTPAFYCDINILYEKRDEGHGRDAITTEIPPKPFREGKAASALLGFHGDAVQWYPFLRDEQLYRLDGSIQELQKHSSCAIQKLSSRGVTQPLFVISKLSQLHSVEDFLHSGDQTMAQGNQSGMNQPGKKRPRQRSSLASLSGVITKKVRNSSGKEEPHTSRQPAPRLEETVSLEMRDSATQDLVLVVMPSHIHDNHMGLIPGAWITLRNCQKKEQRRTVCYEVGPLTSVQVNRLCTRSFNEIASRPGIQGPLKSVESAQPTVAVKQRSMLYHIIQDAAGKKDPVQTFWIHAHVLLIKKLIFRWVCNICGRNDCHCSAANKLSGKIVTQITVVVEDGTGECMVWSDSPKVVSSVFCPTPGDWTKVEDLCSGPGQELVFQKWANKQKEQHAWEAASSTSSSQALLRSTLSRYDVHHSLQRPLWFKCRHFRESSRDGSRNEQQQGPTSLVLCCTEACS